VFEKNDLFVNMTYFKLVGSVIMQIRVICIIII